MSILMKKEGKEADLTLALDGRQETLCFALVPNTGWMIAVLIHESVIHEQFREIGENNHRISQKYVNDTMGHAAGDRLIKDACDLICEHFSHGAVFRIGGDEFAVILQGKAYDTMEEDIASFNSRIEKNIYGNGVVVAIGHSELKEEDGQIHDIFERADNMMYQRKKELKSMGAKVRD